MDSTLDLFVPVASREPSPTIRLIPRDGGDPTRSGFVVVVEPGEAEAPGLGPGAPPSLAPRPHTWAVVVSAPTLWREPHFGALTPDVS